MTLSICETANILAVETWTLLGYSYERKRRAVDERGLTDRNLLTLEMLHTPQVWVGIFPQSREALTGADFEWWIGDGHTYLPMLVQAKRLDVKGNYVGLDKRLPRSRTLQITRLIQMCTVGRKGQGGQEYVGHLPAYLFYNTLTPAGIPTDLCCGHLSSALARGCTIAHATQVLRRLRSRPKRGSRSITRIGPGARPWSCLFCCPNDEMADTAHLAKSLLEDPSGSEKNSGLSKPRTRDQLPIYVRIALDEGAQAEWIGGETRQLPGAPVVAVTTIPRRRNERQVEINPNA